MLPPDSTRAAAGLPAGAAGATRLAATPDGAPAPFVLVFDEPGASVGPAEAPEPGDKARLAVEGSRTSSAPRVPRVVWSRTGATLPTTEPRLLVTDGSPVTTTVGAGGGPVGPGGGVGVVT